MLDRGFAKFLYRVLYPSFKPQYLPHINGGLCIARCLVVAQTQGYHLVSIGVAWLNSSARGGLVLNFDVLRHWYAVS